MFLFNTYKSIELVENVSNNQIFLNHENIAKLGLDLNQVKDAIVNEIINFFSICPPWEILNYMVNISRLSAGIRSKGLVNKHPCHQQRVRRNFLKMFYQQMDCNFSQQFLRQH